MGRPRKPLVLHPKCEWKPISEEINNGKILCRCSRCNETTRKVNVHDLQYGKSTKCQECNCHSPKYKFIDITGNRYGRLTVLKFDSTLKRQRMWNCLCDCGDTKIVSYGDLKKGAVASCGCLLSECQLQFGAKRITHGKSSHPLYSIYMGIKTRCYDKTSSKFKYYGAAGVEMTDEWKHSFIAFYTWAVANGWEKGKVVCRKGDLGNYHPDNCFIESKSYNAKTRKNNKINDLQARIIRKLAESGESRKQILNHIPNVTYSIVRSVLLGYTHKFSIQDVLTQPLK